MARVSDKAREETRRDRYHRKSVGAITLPVSIATVNFGKEANIAYVIRAAACFGAFEVNVIGNTPGRELMNDLSGTTYDYVKLNRFSNPEALIEYCRLNEIIMISFELPSDNFSSIPLNNYEFNFNKRYCIVVGHETMGVPVNILAASERLYIPMPGIGFCLNTSQTANVALYEIARRFGALNERYYTEDF